MERRRIERGGIEAKGKGRGRWRGKEDRWKKKMEEEEDGKMRTLSSYSFGHMRTQVPIFQEIKEPRAPI